MVTVPAAAICGVVQVPAGLPLTTISSVPAGCGARAAAAGAGAGAGLEADDLLHATVAASAARSKSRVMRAHIAKRVPPRGAAQVRDNRALADPPSVLTTRSRHRRVGG